MFQYERLLEITQQIRQNKSVSVKELSRKLFASEATIRRDLSALEKNGVITRTHGGAVLLEGLSSEIPLVLREEEQKEAKQMIGLLAAGLVTDNMVLFLDSSSSVMHIVPHLKSRENLTIITNGAKTAVDCASALSARIYSTGGLMRENSMSFIGETARMSAESFQTDMLFFSCRAVSMEEGLTDISEDEAELRRILISHTKKAVLMCDYSKIGKVSFKRICPLADIDVLITDQRPADQWFDFAKDHEFEIICPGI
jgi:DeoR family fructose operon transcriptional repressor